jgi:alkylated DNA repair dioxygenase AlkB
MSKTIKYFGYEDVEIPKSTIGKKGKERHFLDPHKKVWVDIFYSKSDISSKKFRKVYALRPAENGKIMMMGKEITVPRAQQSYCEPYTFSGMTHSAEPLPEEIQEYMDEANETCYAKYYKSRGFNECLVNWYIDGSENIGAHSDDEKEIHSSPKGKNVVWSMTLQAPASDDDSTPCRIFRLKPKPILCKTIPGLSSKSRVDINLENGMVVVMGGFCQKLFTHQVPKTKQNIGPRINITFRSFVESLNDSKKNKDFTPVKKDELIKRLKENDEVKIYRQDGEIFGDKIHWGEIDCNKFDLEEFHEETDVGSYSKGIFFKYPGGMRENEHCWRYIE